jgi:hypothetical protein
MINILNCILSENLSSHSMLKELWQISTLENIACTPLKHIYLMCPGVDQVTNCKFW